MQCSMHSAFLSILLYLSSAQVRLLLVYAMGLRMLLSGTSSLWQFMLFLVCSRKALNPTPDASVSMYKHFVSLENSMQTSFLIIAFASWNILVCGIPHPFCFGWCQFSEQLSNLCCPGWEFTLIINNTKECLQLLLIFGGGLSLSTFSFCGLGFTSSLETTSLRNRTDMHLK